MEEAKGKRADDHLKYGKRKSASCIPISYSSDLTLWWTPVDPTVEVLAFELCLSSVLCLDVFSTGRDGLRSTPRGYAKCKGKAA